MTDAVSMINETHIQNLIARYLNGDCSENETEELFEWTTRSADNTKEFLQLKDLWDLANPTENKSDQQLLIFYRKQLEQSNRARIRMIKRIIAVAAILVICLITSIIYPRKHVESAKQLSIFTVPLGSRSKVMMSDSTEVYLNSGSSLTFPAKYTGNNRRVTLSGEAFFKVKSDKNHPFIVKTANFDIEATGTQFNVCTYDSDPFSSATLAEGLISLRMKKSDEAFVIKPGEKFRLNRLANTYNLAQADIESELAWKNGEFIFKNIPFPELVQRLERWYDVRLVWSGSKLENFAYTGRFKNQETIWQVLDALKLTTPINFQKTAFREFGITYKPKM